MMLQAQETEGRAMKRDKVVTCEGWFAARPGLVEREKDLTRD
jgi:hypothetical protein